MALQLPGVSTPHVHLQRGTAGRGNMRTGHERTEHFRVEWEFVDDFIVQVFGTYGRAIPKVHPNLPYFYADDYSIAALGTNPATNDFQYADVGITFRTLEYSPEDPDMPWTSVEFEAVAKTFPAPEGSYKFDTGDADLDAYPVPGSALFMVETGIAVTIHRVHFDLYFENLDIILDVTNKINNTNFRLFDFAERKVLCTGCKSSPNYWVGDEQCIDLQFHLQISRGDSEEESENPRWDRVIHPKQDAGWRPIVNGEGNPPIPETDLNQLFDIA